ncbi:hypothetical protein EVAR_103914_1 [Eumeta japonica]|uniref:Uncharacterized protein n=1 Tax=Eumeta variegata TaxID=151549 RepID=A0A4C2AAI3_EUMVA|nr:hypothetical protein EVAR_103914_1 [Eumeta japonica]
MSTVGHTIRATETEKKIFSAKINVCNCLNRIFESEDVPDASPLTFNESQVKRFIAKLRAATRAAATGWRCPSKVTVRARGDSARAALSSPCLATRTDHRLAADERVRYPDTTEAAEGDLYMDDLVSICLTELDDTLLSN